MNRLDIAELNIPAAPTSVYTAFSDPNLLSKWLPPRDMFGEIKEFDFRSGGSFQMRLTYKNPQKGKAKTTDSSDDFKARILEIENSSFVVWEVTFESDDPLFTGAMVMKWKIMSTSHGCNVSVVASNVPPGISKIDHIAGLKSSLQNLKELFIGENEKTQAT